MGVFTAEQRKQSKMFVIPFVAFKAENLVEAASGAFQLILKKHSFRLNREPKNLFFAHTFLFIYESRVSSN